MDQSILVSVLNEDLAGELAAVIQYTIYAAKVTGPYRPQLVQFMTAEIADELGHAQFLANKVAALGGDPTTVARPVAAAKTNKEMLEAILKAELETVKAYVLRAEEARSMGDVALAVQLENMVVDENHHAQECERILRDWGL